MTTNTDWIRTIWNMTRRFDKIVEEWATVYRPMQHTPGKTESNRRFFLFDSIVSIPQFTAKLPKTKSPCVGFEFPVQGTIMEGKIRPSYCVYFLVNAGTVKPTEKELAADAVNEALMHAKKFLAWLNEQSRHRRELMHIRTDSIPYDTYGPLLNGWYAVFLTFEDVETINGCIDPNDYVKSPDNTL